MMMMRRRRGRIGRGEEEKEDEKEKEEDEKEKEEEEDKEQEDKDEGKEKQQEKMRVCSVPESSRTKKTTLWLLPRTLHEHLWFFFALLCAYAQSQHQRSCKVQRITTNVPQQRTLGIRRPAYHQQRPTCRWLSPPHLLTRDLLPFACAFICATL